ncbi:GPP34 family phosphoprotein [Streptomyces sp. SID3343]|uniref:GOLPH3/VPS74 family protein n=1 Tax=Streptomyces sp. SID3343 TaxID=2690260 RepID=UPI001369975E|nr:GPP34 family phosphoprotein [Streptomyces sp. SID3343]MYW03429.1 hypothetical protein [Streptomyces sp. SID3343]
MDTSLVQRTMLLACSPERQRLMSRSYLGSTLQAAALLELTTLGLIEDRDGRVVATSARGRAPGCDLQVAVLARITASERARSWRHWIRKQDRRAPSIVRDALARDRVIKLESHRFLGVLPGQRITLRQPQLRSAATKAMWDALKPGNPVARVPVEDAALAVLAYEGELRVVLGGKERRAAKGRVREFASGLGPVPSALRAVVRSRKSS